MYIQYGQNTSGWAGTRFFDEQVTISSQTENGDGSITVVGNVHLGPVGAYTTDFFKGNVSVHYTAKVNGQVVHVHDGGTGDQYLVNPGTVDIPFTVTISPQTESDVSSLTLDWVYPNREYPNLHFVAGIALYNPTPPTYIPLLS